MSRLWSDFTVMVQCLRFGNIMIPVLSRMFGVLFLGGSPGHSSSFAPKWRALWHTCGTLAAPFSCSRDQLATRSRNLFGCTSWHLRPAINLTYILHMKSDGFKMKTWTLLGSQIFPNGILRVPQGATPLNTPWTAGSHLTELQQRVGEVYRGWEKGCWSKLVWGPIKQICVMFFTITWGNRILNICYFFWPWLGKCLGLFVY